MCNLYSNMMAHEAMTQFFSVRPTAEANVVGPKRAVFPRNRAAIVVLDNRIGERELRYLQWGFLLPQRSKRTGLPIKPKAVVNARSESITTSPFWQNSFRHRRCLVPATAYCELVGRQPVIRHWFGVANDAKQPLPFAFAGLWQTFEGKHYGEGVHHTFTIATTRPNELASQYHNRMPVIVDNSQYDQWLLGDVVEAKELLNPFDTSKMLLLAKGANMTICPI